MVTLKQFNGSVVTPSDDAKLYHLLYGRSGIVDGIQVTHAGTNQVSVSAGWGVVYGRVFTVETQTLGVTLSGGAYGRLKIIIDLSNITTPAYFESEAAAVLSALTQENLSASGNVYEVSICTYDVGAIAISNLVDTRPIITINNAAHMQMTGYTKPASYSALSATDTVNQAVGKLEAGIGGKANLTGAAFTGSVDALKFLQPAAHFGEPNELGKYIDMHEIGSTADYDVRLAVEGGFLHLDNPNRATTGNGQYGQILTRPNLIPISADVTLNPGVMNGHIIATNSSPITIMVPTNAAEQIPVGASLVITQANTGIVNISSSLGVGLLSPYGRTQILTRFSRVFLTKSDTDFWILSGELAPRYITASSSRDFELTDAGNTLLFDTSSNPIYFKIRLESVVNFPIGTIIRGRKTNTTGYAQITYDAGVLVQGLSGSYAQSFGIEKIGANQWTAYSH